MTNTSISVPSREYIEMTFVKETATGRGLNTQFIMENTEDGFFTVIDGRTGIKAGPNKPKHYKRNIEDWDDTFYSKIKKGYLVTKTQRTKQLSVKYNEYKEIDDAKVKELVDRLRRYADQYIEDNFTVKVDDISDEMIDYGGKILNEMQLKYEKMSVAEFNSKLKVLYSAIPRRINKLSEKLAKSKLDFIKIIEEEQEVYDLVTKQVKLAREQTSCDFISNETILDKYGLEIRYVTADEEKDIRRRLGNQGNLLKNAWKVSLKKSEEQFNDFCQNENLTEENGGISHLFHGSKHQLWWSILTNGIWCEPEKHPDFHGSITGKAGGLGAYFAPDAIKSRGYTSYLGSRYAKGTEATGFMALFKVATGKQYYGDKGYGSNFKWDKLQQVCPGAHCLWLKTAYSGFCMDEVIVYQEKQFTIDYLIEIGQ